MGTAPCRDGRARLLDPQVGPPEPHGVLPHDGNAQQPAVPVTPTVRSWPPRRLVEGLPMKLFSRETLLDALARLHRDERGAEGLEKLLIIGAIVIPLLALLI